ncbi:SusC/RagA family TonB-linked outer membrane protein [Chitinophaga horti]|uniref:SusC/RagA family TonB-linked outer membrane protein n=1 Tax=Chitinophaga horti TaxID=2920382 RepID=A0ABY6IZD5_9BACT|nr:SusC/RagA family TonB-linked outer membrane protein [Chitinophaga horti]UYQ91762.1 SusC/RagA family TonB-linked outer membrane protein [Chitinophaga horti]
MPMYLMVHSYSIRGWIKKFPLALLMLPALASIPSDTHASTGDIAFQDTARQQMARGRVMDEEENIPLPGVTVENLVRRKGVLTTANGDYAIAASIGDSLRFSYIGKRPTIAVFRGAALNVSLAKQEGVLSEVVVTGFQDLDKRKFSGSAVTLKADDVRMDGVVDVSRMLEGRAAGVSVQNVSGSFGAAPKVRVRGATSINGDNKPLWVVDNVVLEDIVNISNDQLSSGDPTTLLGSAVAGLNANDIESFAILKDAAATALYGARAMNGVVVITTKKGRIGKPLVTYTGNFSTQLKPSYREYNIMNSAEQMGVLSELEDKGALKLSMLDAGNYGVYGKYWAGVTQLDADGNFVYENTPEAELAYLQRYARVNTDWFDLLFNNNLLQEHSLAISFGTDKSQSYFSTSFYNDNGWAISDRVSRYTLNFRNNYTFSDRLKVGFSTLASVRQQKAAGSLGRNPNPVEGQFDRDFDINPFSFALNSSRTVSAFNDDGSREFFTRNFAPFNILSELDNNYIDINLIDLRLQGDLNYKLTNDLRYEFVGALRYVKSSREHQITEDANMANAYRAAGNSTIRSRNRFLYRDPDNPEAEPEVVLPYGGFYNRTEDQLLSYDFRNSLNYNKTFNEVHSINVLAGMQVKSADRQNFNNTGYGYQYGNGGVPFVDYRILKQTIESNFPYYGMSKDYDRFVAFYGSAGYSFDAKYNFTGTVRYDGSNRLGSSRSARWLPTWSLAGSWNLDRENFMDNVDKVDYLTVRASYGLTASMGPATNSTIVLRNINATRPYLTETESVIQLANLENSELTWEKSYTANVGLDAGFFGQRVNVSLDAYQRKGFDLISIIRTSGIGGESEKAANYADMDSWGTELLIGGQVIKKRDWGWRTNLTFGYNHNEITRAENRPRIFDLVVPEGGNVQGYPVRSLFSIKFAGLSPVDGGPLFIDETGKQNNAVYLQDQNISYLQHEGQVDPTVTGGFSNTFNYKDFSFNFFITYQWGNTIRLNPVFKTTYSDLDALPREFENRWVLSGDEKVTTVPSLLDAYSQARLGGGVYPYNNYNYSTQRVAKGDFIRLKTISLAYTLPPKFLNRIHLNSASVSAVATNPWLIYSDSRLYGQDPEFFNAGGVALPIQKQYTLSLKVGI